MDPPPNLVFHQDLSWSLKEPVVVTWQDELAQTASLGQPCLQSSPQLTLWVGNHAKSKSSLIMLQLTLTKRVAKRLKSFDLFMVIPPECCSTKETSTLLSSEVIHDVRPRLQQAHGESSSRRWLHVPFSLDDSGPCSVLMNIQPEGANPFTGTVLHLLMLFRSLSQAKRFDVYIGYSDYAKLSLSALETRLRDGHVQIPKVDLLRSYNQQGGTYNHWVQFNSEHFKSSQPPTTKDDPALCLPAPPPYEPPPDCDAGASGSERYQHDQTQSTCVSPSELLPSKRAGSFCSQGSPSKVPKLLSPILDPPLPAYSTEFESSPVQSGATPARKTSPRTPSPNNASAKYIMTISPYNSSTSRKVHQEDIKKATEGISTSPSRLLNSTALRSLILAKAEDLINEQLPRLTHDALQQNMDDFLDNVQDNHQIASVELAETVDEAKTELHGTRDEGIDTMEEYARECLVDFETELDAIMNNAAVALESRTIELKSRLDVHWRALRKTSKDRNGLESTRIRQRSSSVLTDVTVKSEKDMSTAAAATRLFMRDYQSLHVETKVKVLGRLAADRNADVWMNVDKEMRDALVDSWTSTT